MDCQRKTAMYDYQHIESCMYVQSST